MEQILCAYPRRLWDELIERCENARKQGRNVTVLVPGQYTLDTEERLLRDLHLQGFFDDLKVLSPARLKTQVFALAGQKDRTVIDSCGRHMALARVLSRCGSELSYYKSAAENPGFIDKAGVQIAQFKQAGMTPEALESAAKGLSGAAREKAEDLLKIYSGYCAELEGKYMDGEDETADMLERLPRSGLMENTSVFVYGFDMITEELRGTITALAACARDCFVFVCADPSDAFAPVKDSLLRLQKSLLQAEHPAEILWLKGDQHPVAPEIRHMQEQLLSASPLPYSGECPGIRLTVAPNAYTEMHIIAENMLLENRAGVPFSEMVLVTDGAPATLSMARSVLSSYMIPLYTAQKLPAVSHGLSRFLLSSLRFLESGAQEEMLDIVRSSYFPAEEKKLYEYENYILSKGIRGGLFDRAFRRGPEEKREVPEECRKAIMAPLKKLKAAFSKPEDTTGILTGIYNYLTETGAYDTLTAQRDRLEQDGFPDKALQNDQVWEALMRLLDQMHALLEGYELTCDQAALFLEAGLREKELSALPPVGGCVMVGAIGNMPLNDKQIVFAAGLCDTLMNPATPALLSDQEREQMEGAAELYLSLSGPQQDDMRRLDIWKAFSAPSKKLYLSHPNATQEGASLSPLALLTRVKKKLFPKLQEEGGMSVISGAQQPLAPGPALNMIPVLMQKNLLQGKWREAWKYLCTDARWARQTGIIRTAFLPPLPSGLPADLARRLFGDREFSISRLEDFACCPFKNFVEHGLKPQPREDWDIPANESGTFYHDCMESFVGLLPHVEGWPQIDKATCDAAMEEAIAPHMEQLLAEGPMQDSARLRYAGLGYKKALKQVAWAFTKASKGCAFRPQGAEVSFGFTNDENSLPALPITMPDGTEAYLRGRIDRIDRYEGDEGLYMRVVDYKSSQHALEPNQVWWGTQLQLLLYMGAALENDRKHGKETQPAGAFYSHITNPLIDGDDLKTDLEDALAKALQLNGIVLHDAEVVRLMNDGTGTPGIPAYLKKGGDFRDDAKAASMEQLYGLIGHARKKAGELMQEMMRGDIGVSPLKIGNSSPCQYCDYSAVCRRDPTDTRCERKMDKMKFGELLENIDRELEEKSGKSGQGTKGS